MERTSRDPSETTLSPLYYLFVAGQRARQLLAVAMVDSPLTPEEYALYSAIFELAPVAPTRLADEIGLPLTTLLDRLRALESAGHVDRAVNPADRRSFVVRLTDDGRRLHTEAGARFEVADIRLRAALPLGADEISRMLIGLADAAVQARQRSSTDS